MRRSFPAILCLSALVLGALIGQGLSQAAQRTGEITKLDAAAKSFMIKTARRETNILTTDQTVLKDGDKPIKFADLKVGDHVKIQGERKGSDVEAKEIVREAAGAGGS